MDEKNIKEFIIAICGLPSDKPRVYPGKWYRTQKEHWLGWLLDYHGPGYYKRTSRKKRNARFAYNHIVNYEMLLWLMRAAGVPRRLAKDARTACAKVDGLGPKSKAIRSHVTWDDVARALWRNEAGETA